MGLLAYKVTNWESGARLERLALGIDIRLSGPDRGISFGPKSIVGDVPELKIVEHPESLPDEVLEYCKHAPLQKYRTKTVKRGALYFTEELTSQITLIEAHNLGLNWRLGQSNTGLSLGYSNTHQLVGRALEDGIVHVRLDRGADDHGEAIKLWALKPAHEGESGD